MTLKILVAPAGFKESLDAEEVANCIAKGILMALPDAEIKKAPLVDGGARQGLVARSGTAVRALPKPSPTPPAEACIVQP